MARYIYRMPSRPPFIVASADVPEKRHRYPSSDKEMAPARAIGRAAGLLQIGIHLVRLPPGTGASHPHAESAEEEFAYVIEGEVDAWVDGELHHMKAGDLAAFPSGTGICHTFINDGDRDALLLAGDDAARRPSDRAPRSGHVGRQRSGHPNAKVPALSGASRGSPRASNRASRPTT